MGNVRTFVAVPMGAEARHRLAHLVDGADPIPGRALHPRKWHLTLRFLGEIDAVQLDRVTASLDQSDLGEAFPMRWGGLGAFPRPRKATVLWVGVDRGEAELVALAEAVEESVVAAGLPPEERPFRPHLTLSRIRPPQDVAVLVDATAPLGVAMDVDRVALYRSHLGGSKGARYEELESFPLSH